MLKENVGGDCVDYLSQLPIDLQNAIQEFLTPHWATDEEVELVLQRVSKEAESEGQKRMSDLQLFITLIDDLTKDVPFYHHSGRRMYGAVGWAGKLFRCQRAAETAMKHLKERWLRGPRFPSRARSAYLIYLDEKGGMSEDRRQMNTSDVFFDWQSLSKRKRDEYERKSEEEKTRFRRELAEYKETKEYRESEIVIQEMKQLKEAYPARLVIYHRHPFAMSTLTDTFDLSSDESEESSSFDF